MSESTSSPSNVHPVSPSSSLSTDSAPRSEPTSDEQPDLGFNELLREYSHLQPHPRIPIQIRSATSSTTPTYHAESVTGSDFRIRSGRGNSRGTPSVLSTLSTFTRPPTSSVQPDGSTVWAHPLIASYLPRSTPSNETYPEEEEEEEEDYSPSESASRASTALTVEIRDFRPFDDEPHELDLGEFSPEPTSAIPIQVESENQRLDSLETPQTEDDIDSLSSHNQIGVSEMTSRGITIRTVTSSSQEHSDNSMHLQSQRTPPATTPTSSLSLPSSDDTGMSISIAGPSASSSINSRIDNNLGLLTSSESTSTLMNVFLNHSSNPIPPHTMSDSSHQTTRIPSSSISLISYQLPETPSVANVHHEDSEPEMLSNSQPRQSNGSRSLSSAASSSIAVLIQPSLGSSSSRSTALPQRPFNSLFSFPISNSSLLNPHSVIAASPLTNPHSLSAPSPLQNPHSLPASSPLPNPHSSIATPETKMRLTMITDRFVSTSGNATLLDHSRAVAVVNDLDTPTSEAIIFEPALRIFEPIHDDEDEPGTQIPNGHSMHIQTLRGIQPADLPTHDTNDTGQSTGESYRPGGHTPRYHSGRTPKGMPTVSTRSQATGNSQSTSYETNSLEQRPVGSDTSVLGSSGETSYTVTLDFPSENGRFVPASIQSNSLQLRQGTVVDSPPPSLGFEHFPLSSSSTSHPQENLRTQPYPTSVGLHLLPSEPLHALVDPPSSSSSLLELNSVSRQFSAEVGLIADPEAEQLYVEATASQTRLLPSLGYLDEALRFIASERVRLTAARSSTNISIAGDESSSKEQVNRESEGDDDALRQGEDWRDAIGGEKGDESKRKRRRKRPSKLGQQVPPESPSTKDQNAADGPQSTTTSSPKKRRSKSAAPPLSSSASVLSQVSSKSGTMTPGRRKDRYKGKEFLIPPPPPSSRDPRSIIADSDLEDGGRTPTNVPVPGIIKVSTVLGTNLKGMMGKRIGRRERDKEKLKFDMAKTRNHKRERNRDPDSFDDPIDIDVEYGPNADNNDGAEATENGENDSISNMSLLQPPRRLRKSQPAETSLSLITKDIPTTTIPSQSSINSHAGEIKTRNLIVNTGDEDVFTLKQEGVASGEKEKEKKKAKPKPMKSIIHSRSYPTLSVAAELTDTGQIESKVPTTDDKMNKSDESNQVPESFRLKNQGELASPKSKQSRLLALAQSLQQLFPEQREEVVRVIKRVESHQMVLSSDTAGNSEQSLGKSLPIPVPAKGKKAKNGHARTASEGAITTGSDSLEVLRVPRPMADVEEEEDIDPRGRLPKKEDPLIHVFVDHSNILIGLLSHLRRTTPYRKRIYTTRRKPLPASTSTTQAGVDPVADAKSTSSRALPTLPTINDNGSSSSGKDHPIPLPSFATLSRSFPSASLLSTLRKTDDTQSSEEFERHVVSNSDGCDGSGIEGGDGSGGNSGSGLTWQKGKKPSKHLWHAALILILERGRPISRRVVVASSPLYQPMETIKRFGYELRVFIRVPDIGDGLDRDHNAEKGRTNVGKTSHAKRISGSESGSGGNASGAGGSSLHPYYPKANIGTSPGKVKYREQGVDELLQLKLHQAIAASDDVPDGSTIILATGDGNMGQFNDDGFLGPIRTALRRGWKVELYAWEGGLSRAWKREFGGDTEWGKRGRFRIIGMEQFASWLVEASEWA